VGSDASNDVVAGRTMLPEPRTSLGHDLLRSGAVENAVGSARQAIRRVIPYRQRASLRRLPDALRLVGRNVRCNCCGWRFRHFEAHRGRPNSRCPRCGAAERHRLLALYLRARTDLFRTPLDVLQFAPEEGIVRVLERSRARTVSVDIDHPLADQTMDIRSLTFGDGSFDLVLCNHVLEHVWEDRAAMAELYRVLRPGGVALVMVPWDEDAATTREDPAVVDPADRLRLYGQEDHVRYYGRDLLDRLARVGFSVQVERFVRELSPATVRGYALADSPIFRCEKPAASPPPA
jgi:SAM-dependent methyltransferase